MNFKSNDIIECIQENVQWLDKDAIVQILRHHEEANERFTVMCDDIESFNTISEQASFIDIDDETFEMVMETLDGLNHVRQAKISMSNRLNALTQTKIEPPAMTPKVHTAVKVADKAYQARDAKKQMVTESVKERIAEAFNKNKPGQTTIKLAGSDQQGTATVQNKELKTRSIKNVINVKNGAYAAAGMGLGYLAKRKYEEYKDKKKANEIDNRVQSELAKVSKKDLKDMEEYKQSLAETLELNVLLGEENTLYVEQTEVFELLDLCEGLELAELLEDIKTEVNHHTNYQYLECEIELL